MKKNSALMFITRTAIFLALLIAVQFFTRSLGQWVTGSLVNLILVMSVITCGLWSAVTVAAVSPLLAFFMGIGPALPHILPVVALGNVVIVAAVWLIGEKLYREGQTRLLMDGIGVVIGAVLKFLTLYFLIVKVTLPLIPGLPEKQIAALSAAFSVPQLFTALIGGVIAILIGRRVKKVNG